MVTWVDFKDQIRRNVLNDEDGANWKDSQIYDFTRWALDVFCQHTAPGKELVIEVGSLDANGIAYDLDTATSFDLPDDLFEDLAISGLVFVRTPNSTRILDPLRTTPGAKDSDTNLLVYWQFPFNKLNLHKPLGAQNSLVIRYFAYYDPPDENDPDAVIPVPRWALKPIASLVGSFALESQAVQSATIDRWKDRSDSGNPEQNALRVQQAFLRGEYERELSKHPSQDRVTYFREMLW
jgi:hypothetical protein